MNFGDIELSVLISITTGIVAVAGFSLSRRKERDENVQHQAFIDATLKQIQATLQDMTLDIKEIKETSGKHSTRIDKLEVLTRELQKQLEGLARAFHADKGIKY